MVRTEIKDLIPDSDECHLHIQEGSMVNFTLLRPSFRLVYRSLFRRRIADRDTARIAWYAWEAVFNCF